MALDFVSVVHVNVNCSRLERSLAFYRDALGLAPLSHTNPLPQDGAGFGLPGRVQWDAWILHDDRGPTAQGIDLLEWKLPAPTGSPAPANALGFARLSLCVRAPHALHAQLAAAGFRPLALPGALGGTRRGIVARDPDGALVELVESPDGPAGPRLAGVVLGVASLARSVPWYERLLGQRAGARQACEAEGAAFGLAGRARWSEVTLEPTPSFAIRLVEWAAPVAPEAKKRAAHALGLYRMALLVDDAAKACAELTALGIAHSGAVRLDMGPDLPIDGLRAGFFPDPDGACLEWIERPRVRPTS